ncbi:MAG: hypothetical protein JGK28_13530 [Microcoleus sp. PH2017_07_MST_O_A]|nr:hypothetical protein [Microcoleus sp. PH2017_07_MST_O_A]
MLIGGRNFPNSRYKSIPEQPDLLRVSPWKPRETARSNQVISIGISRVLPRSHPKTDTVPRT